MAVLLGDTHLSVGVTLEGLAMRLSGRSLKIKIGTPFLLEGRSTSPILRRMQVSPLLYVTMVAAAALMACSASGSPASTPAPTPRPFGITVDPSTHGPDEEVTVTVSGLAPGETVDLRFDSVGTEATFSESVTSDSGGQVRHRITLRGELPSATMLVTAARSSGEIATSELRWTGPVRAARSSPPPQPSPPQPSPTPEGFVLRAEVSPAGGASIVVWGLRPNEGFVFVAGIPGRPGVPEPQTANANGQFAAHYTNPGPEGVCLLAKRSTGEIARGGIALSAGIDCPADVVYLYLSGPATVRPTEFTSFTSIAPAGEIIEFLALVGPDGPRTPDWSTHRMGQPPEGQLFRFSPEYDRQGPLPAGQYTLSYRVMGQRYDFTLTLKR